MNQFREIYISIHLTTAPYRPASDSIAERLVHFFEEMQKERIGGNEDGEAVLHVIPTKLSLESQRVIQAQMIIRINTRTKLNILKLEVLEKITSL